MTVDDDSGAPSMCCGTLAQAVGERDAERTDDAQESKIRASGRVFDIQRYSTQDGPGVRTTVFLKGCSLRCHWCSNPESQRKPPQLLFNTHRCVKCYACVSVCPEGANRIGEQGDVVLDRRLCRVCGNCIDVCQGKARRISGKSMTSDEVMRIIKKDALFFRNSGGGVTLSGGEPTQQPQFATALLKSVKQAGFHATLDTCGHCTWEALQKMLGYVDLVLFDIKHMDPVRHRILTGVSNELILENASRLSGTGIPVIVRFPLIPGSNDSAKNISAVGDYISKLGFRRLDLLPYHKFALQKYGGLNIEYQLPDVVPPTDDAIREVKTAFEAFRLKVSVVV